MKIVGKHHNLLSEGHIKYVITRDDQPGVVVAFMPKRNKYEVDRYKVDFGNNGIVVERTVEEMIGWTICKNKQDQQARLRKLQLMQ